MEDQRYKISDDAGNSIIALKEDERFVSVGEMAQHVAIDILEDYRDIKNGIKKAGETDIKLSIKVLNAISPIAKQFTTESYFGKDL